MGIETQKNGVVKSYLQKRKALSPRDPGYSSELAIKTFSVNSSCDCLFAVPPVLVYSGKTTWEL